MLLGSLPIILTIEGYDSFYYNKPARCILWAQHKCVTFLNLDKYNVEYKIPGNSTFPRMELSLLKTVGEERQ